jgi:sigma-E factor negative regulatory protein RseA
MLMHHKHAATAAPDAQTLREQLSALMDGECTDSEAQQLSQAWSESDDWKQVWHDYEAVGCALRAHVHSAGSAVHHMQPTAFVQGVMARVQAEDLQLEQTTAPVSAAMAPRESANDALFRWKALASVATMAAVLSVGWQFGGVGAPASQTVAVAPSDTPKVLVASTPTPQWQQVPTQQGTMLRDAELEMLMAAHRQYGGMTALQMPAGFLRTATFDPTVR